MIKNHTAKPFEPKYIGDYRIVKLVGHKAQFQPCQGGAMKEGHLDHIKYVLPADRYISAIPDYEQFGRKTNLRLNTNKIPDLQLELMDKVHATDIGTVPKTQTNEEQEVNNIYEEIFINSIYINVCSYTKCKIDRKTYTTNMVKSSHMSIKLD